MTSPLHAVVTGVSSGIGASIARTLSDRGWQVTGLSRSRPATGFEDGGPHRWIGVDLADSAAVSAVVDRLPDPHSIVHAAGVQRSGRLGALDPAHSEQMWRVHVAAAEILVNGLAPRMVDGGRVVMIGSRTMTGVAGKSQYVATKSALTGMARSWAMELVSRGITVNVVAPGPTDTPMLNDPGRVSTPPITPPLGHFIAPEEVAETVAFLLSPHGRSITGQTIVQCAGTSL
ncbi:SDR family oxidoreductase [Rhodococcus fascians]|uniref:SDR family NAD(P)-dependent oxidoreductase n=1 Tax=Nocardiaceae TaxID=85025 RepID=UPI00070DFF01|nr:MULTISPECIES: SDR family oxidoreductase [Rhodococcus]OZD35961.1 NAD(P)-dependent oxidoreductase [Rhodococcus sp. 06-1477-1B]KQU32261.1 3-oxoacyl-ACP reductase [Rhodococcus sp. Leaf233]MBY3985464.1 SDR family oxidoreductase [Rhodococcus fascians]MBY3995392.1 SDR family oxidoreductase [Rhodococcus fascians]MBY4000288.1 SDR family oxidoreductase [Rhodococcus fascians]